MRPPCSTAGGGPDDARRCSRGRGAVVRLRQGRGRQHRGAGVPGCGAGCRRPEAGRGLRRGAREGRQRVAARPQGHAARLDQGARRVLEGRGRARLRRRRLPATHGRAAGPLPAARAHRHGHLCLRRRAGQRGAALLRHRPGHRHRRARRRGLVHGRAAGRQRGQVPGPQ